MEDEAGRVFTVAGFEMIRFAEELREMHLRCLPVLLFGPEEGPGEYLRLIQEENYE